MGNDPVVLSGTPFVAYFASSTGLPPQAFGFAQFQAANLASALLVSSNPTNLVLTASFHLSFLQFSAWTALPTIAAGVALLPVLMGTEGRRLPKRIDKVQVDPRAALVDPLGAAFGAGVFVLTIVLLVVLSAVGVLERGVAGVWCVTAPAALLVLLRDLAYDLGLGLGRHGAASSAEEKADAAPVASDSSEKGSTGPAVSDRLNTEAGDKLESDANAATTAPAAQPPPPAAPHRLRTALPTTTTTLSALPLHLLPFAFSMFILVEALDHTGWVGVWSGWWGAWARATGAAGCIFLMGVVSVLGCNVSCVADLETGEAYTSALRHEHWRHSPPLAYPHALDRRRPPFPKGAVRQRARPGCGVKLWRVLVCVSRPQVPHCGFAHRTHADTPTRSFPASLAGLLWRHILAEKALHVGQLEFARRNALPLGVTLAVGCLVVGAEVCVMFK